MKARSSEGVRQEKLMRTQELVSSFQVRKKIILRRAGQEMFRLLREIEKETLSRLAARCSASYRPTSIGFF